MPLRERRTELMKITLKRALAGGACQMCGCTELRACPGGCSWDPRYLAQGRLMCSRCSGVRPEDLVVTR